MESKKRVYKTRNNKKEMSIQKLVIIIVVLVIIAVLLTLLMKSILIPKQKKEKEEIANQTEVKAENITSADYQYSVLTDGTERDRMENYCGQFFGFIENKQYEKAYELLYPEFKTQYFPTIEEFTKYVQKIYPSLLIITYDDIDRQGDIYIVTVKVDDAISKNNTKQLTQRIVLQESDYNKFVLSFQVI